MKRRMLDLFCGRFGWGKAFASRGWEVVGVDLVKPPSLPDGCRFMKADILEIPSITHIEAWTGVTFDFACASSPCEEFACFGMKHFRPNPPHPELGIRLFNHTRAILAGGLIPYVMENVRAAQQFVGKAETHCGPFYLWGSAVPVVLPQGISKAKWTANSKIGRDAPGNFAPELNLPKAERKAKLATIPPELANCVADYAERLLEQNSVSEAGERVGG